MCSKKFFYDLLEDAFVNGRRCAMAVQRKASPAPVAPAAAAAAAPRRVATKKRGRAGDDDGVATAVAVAAASAAPKAVKYDYEDRIGLKFFKDSLKRNKLLFIVADETVVMTKRTRSSGTGVPTVSYTVRSFICAQPSADGKDMYVDLICASRKPEDPVDRRHSGKAIMTFLFEFARRNGFESVSLSALPHVLLTYAGWGMDFTFRKDCTSEPIAIPPPLQRFQVTDPDLTRPVNRDLQDFVLTLHNAGLEHEHSYDKSKEDNCKKANSFAGLLRDSCYEDGYFMKSCNVQRRK
jgi:hypothetical protein